MKKNLSEVVEKFQQKLISRREFLKEINHMILNTPVFAGYYEHDIKYDFYALVASMIEKIVSRYKKQKNASFETWFYIVLKRAFFNFLNKQKLKEKKNKALINALFLESEGWYIEKNNIDNINIFKYLTDKEKEIISSKYGINLYNENELNEFVLKIIFKLDKKRKIEDKLAKRYMQIIKIQKDILDENDLIIKEKLKEKEKTFKLYKRNLEKIFTGYCVLPSNKWVAEKLGIKDGTVSSHLNKIKNKLKNRINLN